MLVIHGIWAQGALCLWAEDSLRPARIPARPGRPSRAPRPHPFAADPEVLAGALAFLPGPVPDLVRKAAEDELTRWLPSTAEGPQASPELAWPASAAQQQAVRDTARVTLAAWRLPALSFEPAAALDLLGAPDLLPGPAEQGAAMTVAMGGSVAYWAAVATLAANLAGRGRVLPALVLADAGADARWRPVLTGADAQRAAELTEAMPPLCRSAEPGGEEPARVIGGALAAMTDASVRARLGQDRPGWALLPPRRGPARPGGRPPGTPPASPGGRPPGTPPASPGGRPPGTPPASPGGRPPGPPRGQPARVPLAERWAGALTGADARIAVTSGEDSAEAAELGAVLDAWHAAAQAPAGPVRTCFRLVEPEPETTEPPWRVEFSLQSADDPSLRLAAADVWAGTGGWTPGGIGHLDEELLAGLGAAARLFPELDAGLRSRAPAGVSLDTAGAFRFLKETGPLLSGAGFGVLLPDWARKARLGLKLTSRSASTAGAASGPVRDAAFGLADLVEFRYDLAVGDQALDPDELAELARLKIPLVRIRGQWVELDEANVRAALRFLERGQDGVMRAGDALLAGLRGPEDDLPVIGVDADGWLGDLLSGQADRRLTPVTAPQSFRGTLRPYQERGVAWLSFLSSLGMGGILADSMGLGKCTSASSPIFINGSLITAEDTWRRFAKDIWSDGEGEWAIPSKPFTTNALRRSGGAEVMGAAAITRLYRQHVSEKLRKVRLDDGSEMLITRRHRLLGLHDWTRDLSVGDRICVPARLEWQGQPVDPDLATLLAWQISGGYEGEKRIPDFIVAADDDTIIRFMREYFSAEGSVLTGMRSVEISSASPWLMQQLSCMLRRFGIWLRITEKYKRATNGSGICRPYYVGLIGGASLRRFHISVGFCDPVKQAKLADLCTAVCNTNVEGIPVAVAAVDRILSGAAAIDYPGRPMYRRTSQTLAAYAKLDSDDLGAMRDILAERASREVFYARIVSVEDVDYTGWVYDFEVAEHHNFVAGGMLCHNTVQLLALMAHERAGQQDQDAARQAAEAAPAVQRGADSPQPPGPTLLVCPMSLVGNWQREAERFTPDLAVHVHHGSDRLTGEELTAALAAADLVITTYAIAARDRDELARVHWGRVVCDEAQNIKNPGTRQARAVRSLPAGSRIALTGTPVENRLGELWSIMEFTSPGLLGAAEKFRTAFAIPVERHGDEEAADRLRRLTGPFILRRVKTDKTIISDLPDKIEMKVWCNLTAEQASLYQATVADMMARIEAAEEGIERRGLVLATMAKLKQVCNHPAHLLGDGSRLAGRSGKLARLEELCDEIVAAGDKTLCFTQYAEFGRVLQPHLAARLGCPVLFLHGGTPKKKRDALVAEFQGLTEPAVFLLSLKAGGTGLNLTGANHVVHFDRWWNPAVEDQATDRAFRIGQRKDVQVRKFVCVGTLEERIDAMIEEKKVLADRIVGTGEGWLTELSVTDLRQVLALSPEAVAE